MLILVLYDLLLCDVDHTVMLVQTAIGTTKIRSRRTSSECELDERTCCHCSILTRSQLSFVLPLLLESNVSFGKKARP